MRGIGGREGEEGEKERRRGRHLPKESLCRTVRG